MWGELSMTIKHLIVMGTAAVALTVAGANTPVQAANWHHGTPTALRGNYHHAGKNGGAWFEVRPSTLLMAPGDGFPTLSLHSTVYKRVGVHTYLFSGTGYNGAFKNRHTLRHWKILKKGQHIAYAFGWSGHYIETFTKH